VLKDCPVSHEGFVANFMFNSDQTDVSLVLLKSLVGHRRLALVLCNYSFEGRSELDIGDSVLNLKVKGTAICDQRKALPTEKWLL
jgi:hypothetical protein